MTKKSSRKKMAPKPKQLIHHGPATVVLWGDGTKTVSKLHEGDKYNEMVGILNCVVRKLTDNHGHEVDKHEASMVKIAKKSKDVEGLRKTREQTEFLLDVLDTAIAVYETEDADKDEDKLALVEDRINALSEMFKAIDIVRAIADADDRIVGIECGPIKAGKLPE